MNDTKNILKLYVRNNFLLHWKIKKAVLVLNRREREYKQQLKQISRIDPIERYDDFVEIIQPFVKSDKMQSSLVYGDDGFYGHYEAMAEYAGLETGGMHIIPGMEHGVRFVPHTWIIDKYIPAFALQGKKNVGEIHEVYPFKPVFVTGPYIHYAKNFYSIDKIKELKEKYGKTLLVFPSHTYEESSIDRDQELPDLIYQK